MRELALVVFVSSNASSPFHFALLGKSVTHTVGLFSTYSCHYRGMEFPKQSEETITLLPTLYRGGGWTGGVGLSQCAYVTTCRMERTGGG